MSGSFQSARLPSYRSKERSKTNTTRLASVQRKLLQHVIEPAYNMKTRLLGH